MANLLFSLLRTEATEVLHSFFSVLPRRQIGSEVLQLCPTLCDPMAVTHQAPPSMGFSRQEYWSGVPFPSPGDLPDPGIEPRSPAFRVDTFTG